MLYIVNCNICQTVIGSSSVVYISGASLAQATLKQFMDAITAIIMTLITYFPLLSIYFPLISNIRNYVYYTESNLTIQGYLTEISHTAKQKTIPSYTISKRT